MKPIISKFFISITVLSILVFSTCAISEEDNQNNKIVDETIDEVIVTGIRASLESALQAKRALSNLTEVINADDIGKLPDENIAEVLENIPGVQIDRSGGIGSSVSVRGSSQNRVEINGRSTTPAKDARGGISFSDLPSTLVRSLNVVKVPTADMVEGSLGGTVNVKTYRGLKLRKPLRVVRAKSEYAENADKWNENYSATFGDKYSTKNGEVGVIVNLSHMDKFVREDQLRVTPGIRNEAQSNFDFDGDNINDSYYKPGFSDLEYGLQSRVNTAFSGSLEWQVEDNLKLYAEGSYTDTNNRSMKQSAFIGQAGSDIEMDDPNATFLMIDSGGYNVPMVTSSIIGGGIRNGRADIPTDTAVPNDGVQIRSTNKQGNRDTQSYVTAFGGEWDTDNLNVVAELSSAGSDTTEESFVTVLQFNDPTSANFHNVNARIRVPFYYALDGDVVEYGPMPGTVSAEQLLDPSYWAMYIAKDQDFFYDNKENAAKIDVTKFLDNDIWTSIKAGIRFTQRTSTRARQSQQTGAWPGFSGTDIASYLTPTPGDFFSFNKDGNYLDDFLTLDQTMASTHRDELRELFDLEASGVIDPLQGFGVEENTSALYVRGDFESSLFGIPARGNIGIRGINTDQVASGSEVMIDGTLRDVVHTQNYNNWLPSASLVLAPKEKLQLRFGYASVMRRPDFRNLSPTLQYPLNLGQAVNVGDPTLKPTKAKQFDSALEYYFRKGSVASLGYYYKEMESIIGKVTKWNGICNPRAEDPYADDPVLASPTCTVDGLDGVLVNRISPVNLPGGSIEGLELSFLHYFRNLPKPFKGLGVIANYALQKGSRDQSFTHSAFLGDDGELVEFPLNFIRLSENSYNFTVFYEKYRLNWRVRYTYRDNFLVSESIDVANGKPLYTEDRGQLNASMSYKLNKTFTATLSGVNLLKSRKTNPGVFPDGAIARMSDSDRRISLGLRAKF